MRARAKRFVHSLWLGVLLTTLTGSVWGALNSPVIQSTTLSGNTLTIQVHDFPNGPLSVKFNGIVVSAIYDQPAQTLSATLASVPVPGTYLLDIAKKLANR